MAIRIIGDVHGKTGEYHRKIWFHEGPSIQVGDFGFQREHRWHLNTIDLRHKINFGNHDDYNFLDSPHSLGNFSLYHGVFTVRGANSIDKQYRRKEIDWFEQEQLTYQEGIEVYDEYERVKPSVVVSHDCPQSIKQALFGYTEKTSTNLLLQHLLDIHTPDLWIFGHHHRSKNVNIKGCNFICLKELEHYDV